jgi:hypothetical protein
MVLPEMEKIVLTRTQCPELLRRLQQKGHGTYSNVVFKIPSIRRCYQGMMKCLLKILMMNVAKERDPMQIA